jgi:acyl-CoA thioesterase-1
LRHCSGGRAEKPGPVLVLGDSLSAEYGLTRGKGWVQLLQQRMNDEKNPRKVVNASISGETTAGGRARLASLLRQHEPGIVILELGGNDALRGLALQSTAESGSHDQGRQEAGAQVLLVGMQVPPNYGATYTEQFAGMFKKVADTQKLPLVPFLLSGIGDAADAEQWFQSDRIHPMPRRSPDAGQCLAQAQATAEIGGARAASVAAAASAITAGIAAIRAAGPLAAARATKIAVVEDVAAVFAAARRSPCQLRVGAAPRHAGLRRRLFQPVPELHDIPLIAPQAAASLLSARTLALYACQLAQPSSGPMTIRPTL